MKGTTKKLKISKLTLSIPFCPMIQTASADSKFYCRPKKIVSLLAFAELCQFGAVLTDSE